MIPTLLVIVAAAAWTVWLGRAELMVARIYQIEEYEADRLLRWGSQRAWIWANAALAGAAAACVLGFGALVLPADGQSAGIGVAWLAGAALLHLIWKPLPAKKELVYTARMRRLLGATFGITLVVAAIATVPARILPTPVAALVVTLLCLFAPGLALVLVPAGSGLMAPVEAAIRRGYLKRARARIVAYQPQVIGVAGSYGKTSTKHIIAQLLHPARETLATPKSFNTLMGIVRTINENLEEQHRVFVVEMDAYARGEIAAMCDLVEPKIAVITAVGPQHLERFGTVDAIADALYELVRKMPPGSPAVIYCGDASSVRLADRAAADGYRVVRYGMAGQTTQTLDVVAADATVGDRMTEFTWRWDAEGLVEHVAIPLLGQHNVLNVSAALAVVHLLGLPVADAARVAAALEPIPHRLQLLPNSGGITVIDDSYNANPVGIHNGLDVLAQMKGRAKILVTPGMVELGALEATENQRLGVHAAQVCNDVILVGAQQTQPIYRGLSESGFPADRIHVVQTLPEVTATLSRVAAPGDVVLFANDLPDTYLELS